MALRARISNVRGPSGLALLVALAASCGPEGREVLAHHEDGALRSVAREVRAESGAWELSGPYRSYYADGTLESEGTYEDGVEDGSWTYWIPSGAKSSEGSWDHGEREGTWTFYHDDGRPLAEGAFHADREQGRWTAWYPTGALESDGSYVDGRKEGVWVHRREDGTVDETQTGVYESGRRIAPWIVDGTRTLRYESGATREVAELRDGVLHGACTTFHENGRKASEGRYELGLRTGPWIFWDEAGERDEERSGVYELSAKREE